LDLLDRTLLFMAAVDSDLSGVPEDAGGKGSDRSSGWQRDGVDADFWSSGPRLATNLAVGLPTVDEFFDLEEIDRSLGSGAVFNQDAGPFFGSSGRRFVGVSFDFCVTRPGHL
jgi:hypothetical protein